MIFRGELFCPEKSLMITLDVQAWPCHINLPWEREELEISFFGLAWHELMHCWQWPDQDLSQYPSYLSLDAVPFLVQRGVCVKLCSPMHGHVEGWGGCPLHSSMFSTLVFETQSLTKSEALTLSIRLAVQRAPGIHLFPPPPTLGLPVLMLCLTYV